MTTDFAIQLEKDKPYNILQLTDMQVINQKHCDDELIFENGKLQNPTPKSLEEKCFEPMRKVIATANPSLIIITGDIIYGCFDNNTLYTRLFIDFIESFGIPWTITFGNHDEPSYAAGIDVLFKFYEDAPHCLFRRSEHIHGDSNFTIGLYEEEKLVRVIYMIDSEGYYHSKEDPERFYRAGFARNQIYWLLDTARELRGDSNTPIPGFMCCHNPTADYLHAALIKGYSFSLEKEKHIPVFIGTKEQAMAISPELNYVEGTYPEDADKKNTFLCIPPQAEGDFGFIKDYASIRWSSQAMEPVLHATGIDGVFAGHNHGNNHIMNYNGVKYVAGAKTGTYDPCGLPLSQTGGTLITIAEDRKQFSVEQLYQCKLK